MYSEPYPAISLPGRFIQAGILLGKQFNYEPVGSNFYK